jgi:hypothetical protein
VLSFLARPVRCLKISMAQSSIIIQEGL